MKLYEKSPVKRRFLMSVINELSLNAEVLGDIRDEVIDSDIVVCRAFKKLDQIIQVSREIAKKPHKLMILKGQNAHEEVKNSFKNVKIIYLILCSKLLYRNGVVRNDFSISTISAEFERVGVWLHEFTLELVCIC